GTKLSKSCCKSPRKVCSVAFPSLYLLSKLSIYCSNVIYPFNFFQSFSKKQLFWFFQCWLCVWAKTKCAVCAVGFFLYVAKRLLAVVFCFCQSFSTEFSLFLFWFLVKLIMIKITKGKIV